MEELQKLLRNEMRGKKEKLVRELKNLAIDLNRIADRLEADNWMSGIRLISDLGEIQMRGPMIDVQCASLRTYQKIYDKIVKMEEKDNE